MIYTSYFSSHKYSPDLGVSISRWNNFWTGPVFLELAPSSTLLAWWKSLPKDVQKSAGAQLQYTTAYKAEVLDKLNPQDVYNFLDGKVLLCFEKSTDFCHRHLVTKWFNDAGFECEEL